MSYTVSTFVVEEDDGFHVQCIGEDKAVLVDLGPWPTQEEAMEEAEKFLKYSGAVQKKLN